MRRRLARGLLALSLLAFVGALASRTPVFADDDPLAGLSGEKALAYAKELAADGMKGRKTGFAGGRKAEEWMQAKLGDLGIHPGDGGGTYLFNFNFGATEVTAPIALTIGGEAADYGKEFVDLIYTGAGKAEAEVVFVGYGISAKDRGWDDYDGVDVKGKIVLAIRGAPKERETEFWTERQIGWKSAAAADRGAAGFLVAEGKDTILGTIQEKFFKPALPSVSVSGALADKILGKHGRTLEELKASRDAGQPGRSFSTGVKASLEVNGRFLPNAEGRDAMGAFFGADPDLRKEAVVIGAHLDHLGTDAMGRVFNGADDNASGSAAILMLAETLANNGWRPKRTVIFVWFGGEEQGLVGSRKFVAEMPFAHDSVVAMINVDMAGQGKPEVNLGGGECYPALYELATSGIAPELRETTRPFRADGNSDHWPFYERGIPALFAHSAGEHPNYHQITDDVENLKPACMEAVARVVGQALIKIADAPEPLATGKEAAGLVLREGPRAVEGPASVAALSKALATAPRGAPPAPADAVKEKEGKPADKPAGPADKPGEKVPETSDAKPKDEPKGIDRSALKRPGYATVIVPLEEKDGGAAVSWARLVTSTKGCGRDVVVVKTAADVANAARGGRTAILPRLSCEASARAFPAVLSTYREMGVRWVEPFAAVSLPDVATRAAILDAAIEAKLVVDLTGMPADFLAAARAKLGDAPSTYRVGAPLAADPAAAAAALQSLRAALGPKALVLVSGGAEAPLVTPAALAAADDPTLAPVVIVEESNEKLEAALGVAVGETASYAEPESAPRKKLRAMLGQALVDLLRRIG